MSTSDTNTTATQSDNAEIKIHDYHKHGDVVLKANDGTSFYADSWRLIRASTFFKDLLDIPQPEINDATPNIYNEGVTGRKENDDERTALPENGGQGAEPSEHYKGSGDRTKKRDNDDTETDIEARNQIRPPAALMEINTSPQTLDILLNLASASTPFRPKTSFEESFELLRVAEMLLCNDIVNEVKQHLNETAEYKQWELLVLASDRNDLAVGRVALQIVDNITFIRVAPRVRGIDEKDQPLDAKPFWGRMKSLRPNWRFDRHNPECIVCPQGERGLRPFG